MDLSLKKHTVVKALKLNQGAWRKAFIIIVRKVHALSCRLIWVKCGSRGLFHLTFCSAFFKITQKIQEEEDDFNWRESKILFIIVENATDLE